ncbi:MAG: hydrogenase formation protein HypD [Pseudomonadota bacterium]
MSIPHSTEFRDPVVARQLTEQIRKISKKKVQLMEVCGTHTTAIFRSGIRSMLPETIRLISGPGCPVCVTSQREIDLFLALSGIENGVVTTFGDLMRVPGSTSSLQKERALGRDIRVVYSTMDAIEIAKRNPEKHVIFLGVGFETTAPTIAASLIVAKESKITNFYVASAHKLVPPAMEVLLGSPSIQVDGFMLPGHVSVIIGEKAYRHIVETHRVPCVITGFEPSDILQGILSLVMQIETGDAKLENAYPRAVLPEGNPKAQQILNRVFEAVDAQWRGIGMIPKSGLHIKKEFEQFDALKRFGIVVGDSIEPKGCACGAVLTGAITPPECVLFKKICTPEEPIGPCMVSSEGTCAAYYRFHPDR